VGEVANAQHSRRERSHRVRRRRFPLVTAAERIDAWTLRMLSEPVDPTPEPRTVRQPCTATTVLVLAVLTARFELASLLP
jgi:hypothetical protein